MAKYEACDDCNTVRGDDFSDWHEMTLEIVRASRKKRFNLLLCSRCYDKILNPNPLGIVKRVLSFFSK